MINAFIQAMLLHIPEGAHIVVCQFRGDPNDDIKGKWRASGLSQTKLDPLGNVYFAVSAMKRNVRGELRRRKENFAGGLLLMIDDLGEGPGAKFPMSTIEALVPTALIETSPDNFQAIYMFDSAIAENKMDSLIRAFIAREFLGNDPGMAGVNRVFRPPFGVNGKAKYGGWTVRCEQWNPEARYSPEEIASAYGLELSPRGTRAPRGATTNRSETIRTFVLVRSALRAAGMLKRDEPDLSGWTEIVCPWVDGHSARANTGAAIREPAEENGWNGAFRCHHGSCGERGWRALTDWLADAQEQILAEVNMRG